MAEAQRLAAFRRMRRIATALLILMAGIFFAARALEPMHPAWGYVRAFAEAGMVGGLADWFAVTALFRHPLGLPIPHTAIIPRNKDRIGDTLAAFLRDNFLTPRVVARRLRRIDVAGAAGRFLRHPSSGEGRIRRGASRLIADVVGALDQERLGGMAKGAVRGQLEKMNVAPLLGQMLGAMIARKRHLPVISAGIRWAALTLDDNEHLIRNMVHEKANSIMRWTGLDETLANAIISGLQKLLIDMDADPEHPLRGRVEEGLARLADDLTHDPEMAAKVARMKAELLANPAMANWINGLWEQARRALLSAARDPDAAMAGKLGEMLSQFGQTLQEDPVLKRQINRFARRAITGVTSAYGDNIVRLVSDTVRGWEARTITDRVETAVGRDLQYIRINGTLVGGLVGVTIHLVDVLV
ncbi:DUF445 domain-containing protein [Novosphingopyxis sp. YJ-S2-01]|uniref:DUF445 domain-containing protein n=1 Tax=Novosphingopyxis sp. YJ-S2-01 TaxID=2794021 RepID=UPI001E392EC2|nr:DUF445 domain-containing protein [Novosphingopyxis sp. YJ-S2-01]